MGGNRNHAEPQALQFIKPVSLHSLSRSRQTPWGLFSFGRMKGRGILLQEQINGFGIGRVLG